MYQWFFYDGGGRGKIDWGGAQGEFWNSSWINGLWMRYKHIDGWGFHFIVILVLDY